MDDESELDRIIDSLESRIGYQDHKITADDLLELAKAIKLELQKDIQV